MLKNQINNYNNDFKSIDFKFFYNNIVKNNFVIINLIIKIVKCRKCYEDFNFNNILYRYFRFNQHFNKVNFEINSFTIIISIFFVLLFSFITFFTLIFAFIIKLTIFKHVILFTFTNSFI